MSREDSCFRKQGANIGFIILQMFNVVKQCLSWNSAIHLMLESKTIRFLEQTSPAENLFNIRIYPALLVVQITGGSFLKMGDPQNPKP